MIRTALLIGAALALPAAAHAEWRAANPEVAKETENPRITAALSAVNLIDAALVSDDRAAFAAALAPELAVNNPQNAITRSAGVGQRNASGLISYARYDRIVEYAGLRGDMVLLMGEERVVPKAGMPNAGREVVRRFTDLWREENGRWLLSARQATVVAVK